LGNKAGTPIDRHFNGCAFKNTSILINFNPEAFMKQMLNTGSEKIFRQIHQL
jgi:hypothetical protein